MSSGPAADGFAEAEPDAEAEAKLPALALALAGDAEGIAADIAGLSQRFSGSGKGSGGLLHAAQVRSAAMRRDVFIALVPTTTRPGYKLGTQFRSGDAIL